METPNLKRTLRFGGSDLLIEWDAALHCPTIYACLATSEDGSTDPALLVAEELRALATRLEAIEAEVNEEVTAS